MKRGRKKGIIERKKRQKEKKRDEAVYRGREPESNKHGADVP